MRLRVILQVAMLNIIQSTMERVGEGAVSLKQGTVGKLAAVSSLFHTSLHITFSQFVASLTSSIFSHRCFACSRVSFVRLEVRGVSDASGRRCLSGWHSSERVLKLLRMASSLAYKCEIEVSDSSSQSMLMPADICMFMVELPISQLVALSAWCRSPRPAR
jgi:hypothetical protein